MSLANQSVKSLVETVDDRKADEVDGCVSETYAGGNDCVRIMFVVYEN
jgi:hypothetical protein